MYPADLVKPMREDLTNNGFILFVVALHVTQDPQQYTLL